MLPRYRNIVESSQFKPSEDLCQFGLTNHVVELLYSFLEVERFSPGRLKEIESFKP